jgi:phage terminase large subunit
MEALAFKDTTATKKVFSLTQRIRAVSGGTSASKTISILVWCIDYAQTVKNELVSVVSESYPHLEKGAMLDFENIMKAQGYWDDSRWHATKHTYTFETGTKIEFFSPDTYGKAHGPRRDVLFINEANNLAYKIVDQLITRTRKIVWMDWNPVSEFWFYTEMQPNRSDIDFITLTYLDNEAIDDITKAEIEAHRGNKVWWQVYGLGQLGEIETRIYTGWRIIDTVPVEARLERYGLDFGYTNDPTAIVAIYYLNGEFIWDEIAYQKGLSNKMIADLLLQQPKARVIADSAEPKSIAELKSYKLSVAPAHKGPGSVLQGIQNVQSQWISVTKRSINIIKEYRNYVWITDKDGRILNEPVNIYNHAMDAGRYAMEDLRPRKSQLIAAPAVSGVQPYYPELGI